MELSGRYQLVTEENLKNFMTLLGFSDNEIQTENVGNVTEIEQNGDDFKWTTVSPIKTETVTNTFTVGKRCELESMQGRKQQIMVFMIDGKIQIEFASYFHVAEIVEENLVETFTACGLLGEVTMKRTSKKI